MWHWGVQDTRCLARSHCGKGLGFGVEGTVGLRANGLGVCGLGRVVWRRV